MKKFSFACVILLVMILIFGDHKIIFHDYYGQRFLLSWIILTFVSVVYTVYVHYHKKRTDTFSYKAKETKKQLKDFEKGMSYFKNNK